MAVDAPADGRRPHGIGFYPDFAGVARSHNYYPIAADQAEDGVPRSPSASGRTVVEGGTLPALLPALPAAPPPASRRSEDTARTLAARVLGARIGATRTEGPRLERSALQRLRLVAPSATARSRRSASTYSPENDAIYDGSSRPGVRLVTFAPILKHDVFPLAEHRSTRCSRSAQGRHGDRVEIEFAVHLPSAPGRPARVRVPAAAAAGARALEGADVEVGDVERSRLICQSRSVLGNGRVDDLRDIVVVDFARASTARAAGEALRRSRASTPSSWPRRGRTC